MKANNTGSKSPTWTRAGSPWIRYRFMAQTWMLQSECASSIQMTLPSSYLKLPSMNSKHSNSKVGIIAGSVVAFVVLLSIIVALFWYRRSNRIRSEQSAFVDAGTDSSDPASKSARDRRSSWFDTAHPYSQVSETSTLVPNRYRSPSQSVSFSQPQALAQLHIASPTYTPFSPISPIPHTPSTASPSSAVDIDTLIEMIAHRIDAPRDPDAPLPRYPGPAK